MAQQLALARCGIPSDLDVLGWLVTPTAGRVLYVAADRPRQALRSMRRMVCSSDRRRLDERLLIWPGPLDVTTAIGEFVDAMRRHSVDTIVFDSIKDVVPGDPGDPKIGMAFNRAVQILIAADVEVLALHHNRKAQEGNRTPRKLDDVYGSQWIAAGAGSVLSLVGEAGDATVELRHLKQPAAEVGPLTIVHDHHAGTSRVLEGTTAADILDAAGAAGVTVKEAAAELFATAKPTPNEIERTRRKLDQLERDQAAEKVSADEPGGPTLYRRVTPRDPQRDPSRSPSRSNGNGLPKPHAGVTDPHAPGERSGSSPVGGAVTPERDLVEEIKKTFDAEEVGA